MACSLSITSVTGIGPVAGVPTAIRVVGTATDCPTVNLSIRCPGFTPGNVFTGSATVTGGLWTVDVPAPADSGCLCGGRVVIEATCATDPACTTSFDHNFACEGVCPSAIFNPIAIGDCNPDGTRTVTVSATISSIGPCTAELREGATVLKTVSGSGTFPISYTGNFSGTVNFSVHFTAPAGCPDILATPIILPGCVVMCPPVTWDPPAIGACDAAGNRSVTVTAHVTSAASFLADLRRGAVSLATGSGPGLVNLSNTTTYPGGSTQTFTVAFTSPPAFLTCSASSTVNVPSCGGTGNGGSGFCGPLRIVIAVAGALALLALILIGCLPAAATPLLIAAGIFAALALAAWLVWNLLHCKAPCGWALLLSGQILLGAGVGAIILSGCCPSLILVGLILVALALAALLAWKSRCNETWCALAKEVTYVIGGMILPLIGFIALIPILMACVNGAASAVVGAIFGPIAVYAAAC